MKTWLLIGSTALVTTMACFGVHSLYMIKVRHDQTTALADQKSTLTAQCSAAKKTTEEVSHELQQKLSVRDASLADARRLLNSGKCRASVDVNTSGRHDGQASAGELRLQDGLGLEADGQELFDIAGDAESVRLRLIACQDFVTKNRANSLNQ